MLGDLMNKISGYKSYILAAVGVIVAVVGHFWGPMTIAGVQIPQIPVDAMWKEIWAALSLATLRHGISKGGSNAQTPVVPPADPSKS